MEWVIVVWIVVSIVAALNLSAAGVAAVLHAWRIGMRRGGRIVTAAAVAAFVPTSGFIAIGLSETAGVSGEEPFIMSLVFAAILAACTLVSLPGAAVVARKLDAPGDDFRAFE